MDGLPAGGAHGRGEFEEGCGGGAGAREQDAGLFEEFADRAGAVGEIVLMAEGVGVGWSDGPVEGGEVAAREDVGGGEGGGGLDAVGEEDLVGGRDEDDAGAGARGGGFLFGGAGHVMGAGEGGHGGGGGGGGEESLVFVIEDERTGRVGAMRTGVAERQ